MCILRGPMHGFEFANAAYVRLVGQRDLLGKTVRDALPEVTEVGQSVDPGDLQRLESQRQDTLACNGSYGDVIRLVRPDNGQLVLLQVHGTVKFLAMLFARTAQPARAHPFGLPSAGHGTRQCGAR